MDELLTEKTGFSQEAKEHAMSVVASFEQYLSDHKDEIDALKFFYSVSHAERLRFKRYQRVRGEGETWWFAAQARLGTEEAEMGMGRYVNVEMSYPAAAEAAMLAELPELVLVARRMEGICGELARSRAPSAPQELTW